MNKKEKYSSLSFTGAPDLCTYRYFRQIGAARKRENKTVKTETKQPYPWEEDSIWGLGIRYVIFSA